MMRIKIVTLMVSCLAVSSLLEASDGDFGRENDDYQKLTRETSSQCPENLGAVGDMIRQNVPVKQIRDIFGIRSQAHPKSTQSTDPYGGYDEERIEQQRELLERFAQLKIDREQERQRKARDAQQRRLDAQRRVAEEEASLRLIRELQEQERAQQRGRASASRRSANQPRRTYTLKERDVRDVMQRFGYSQDEAAQYLIRQIQEASEQDHRRSSRRSFSSQRQYKEDLSRLFRSAQSYENADVHAFNKSWSKANVHEVLRIFRAKFPSPRCLDFDSLSREILSSCGNQQGVKSALSKLKSHGGSRGYADRESGVTNTLDLLNYVWHVASTDKGKATRFKYQFGHQVKRGTSRDFVVDSLLENAATGGGCAPGFAGRFVRDLLILLCVQEGVSQ